MTLKSVETILAKIETVYLYLANGLLFAMFGLNLANILSRSIFGKGIVWVFPWTNVLFVWMVFLGFYLMYRRGQDISIDILVRRLPQPLYNAVALFVHLAILTFLTIILMQFRVVMEQQVGNLEMVGIERYWLSVPFFVSCVLVMVQFILQILYIIYPQGADTEKTGGEPS